MGVKVGDRAPDFTLESKTGEKVSLSQFYGQKNVVLYFYPKDETMGCTREACGFRDRYEAFADLGAEVVGVSSDSPESHRRFAEHHRLPFTLLSDPGKVVRKLYGVPSNMGFLPGRVTYVIDKSGAVRHIFNSQMHPEEHVNEALNILRVIEAPLAKD
ncbi:MAG: peroxiredoxin [Cyanobacteria bacterium 13_1_40CM_2_61_4]|nr:MAG: peroxiredoxin [Cyanobacteria bacterium 13_1_40CM_2_61_4]